MADPLRIGNAMLCIQEVVGDAVEPKRAVLATASCGGRTCAAICEDVLLGESASAWKYANKNDVVSVSWTLDLATVYDDVLIFDGALDDDGSLRGTVYTGDAEIGARGAGKRRRVGAFVARR